jgi:hypothetical protein
MERDGSAAVATTEVDVTHGKNTTRIILTAALAALAVGAPVAEAKQSGTSTDQVHVCNQATPSSLGGAFAATDGDKGPASRFQEGLKAHPGGGAGLVRAAANSPALSLCSIPGDAGSTPEVPGDGTYSES